MRSLWGWWVIFGSLVVTADLYVLSKNSISALVIVPLTTLGQIAGLFSIVLLSMSILLAQKSNFIEHMFGGLDKVYAAHHSVGGMGTMLAILHPLLFAVAAMPNMNIAARYFVIDTENFAMSAGTSALLLLLVLIVTTLYIKLPYHIWKSLHQWMGLVIVLSGVHAALIPSDVSRYLPLKVWILGMSGSAIAAFVYGKASHLFHTYRYPYVVESVVRTGDYFDIRLKPSIKKLGYIPGQFVFLTVPDVFEKGGHPFSMVSHPDEECLRFGIKISGDHTLRLRELKRGDPVYVDGPYGRFSERYFRQKNSPVVCVAGGIGITPFVSMVRQHILSGSTIPLTVFYSVSSFEDALYHDELYALSRSSPAVCYRLHVTNTSGRLSADTIAATISLDHTNIFLCGPQPMMMNLRSQLMQKGVSQPRIVYENFSLV